MAVTTLKQAVSKIVGTGAVLLGFPPLFVFGALTDNYTIIYIALITFLFMAIALVRNYLRIILFFLTFYLSIGLLNISTWRGYTTVETISLYTWSMYLLVMPILLLAQRKIDVPFQVAHQQKLVKLVIIGHLGIVFLAVLFVYGTIGNVLGSQHLRFRIPTSVEYIIKSALPIVAVLPFLRLRLQIFWLFALLLPPLMIGSRGTAVMGILAYVIVLLHKNGGNIDLRTFLVRHKRYLLYGLSAAAIISVLFYLRRGGDSGLAAVDVIMKHYFDYDNFLVRIVLPFYLGFKETIGLSTLIITDQVQNTINPYPLLFADLYTVLPGENLAAGQSLSRIFGATQGGGLTPGLLGGIYIDYGIMCVVIFLIIGLLLAKIQYSVACSPYFIIIYAQIITQFIHLFHRGFFKPEYITSIVIAFFYYVLCHRVFTRAR